MPTIKPRITLTLTEHQHAVLRRMSVLGGESMSAIVVDLLDSILPMLERVVVTMQAASDAPQQIKDGMRDSFKKAEEEMLPQLTSLMGQLDMLLEPAGVSALAGAVAAPKDVRPPTSNRGVRNTSKRSNLQRTSPMKTGVKRRGVKK